VNFAGTTVCSALLLNVCLLTRVLRATPDLLIKEQSICITIFFCLGKTALKTPEMFIAAFSDNAIGRTQNFECLYSVIGCRPSGCPSSGGTEENLEKVREIINEIERQTI
jgi:hypothetical protein